MNESDRLLIELDKNLRCVHLDMGGNHKYVVTYKTQPVLRAIKEYVRNLRGNNYPHVPKTICITDPPKLSWPCHHGQECICDKEEYENNKS